MSFFQVGGSGGGRRDGTFKASRQAPGALPEAKTDKSKTGGVALDMGGEDSDEEFERFSGVRE